MMTPLRIRARLRNGYVARDPWTPTLDGILAAVTMRRRLGDDYASSAANPSRLEAVTGLPLEVVRSDDLWWYAASSPRPLGAVARERRFYHRRFDDQHERYLAERIKHVQTSAGPYKNTRLYDTRVICRGVEWHVVGEAAPIRAMLAEVEQIGARREVGYGEVVEWLIDAGDATIARLRRPLPVAYARVHEVAGTEMPWGIVPPLRINPVLCVMPVPHGQD
jgi:CRISPR type IV-associated protein Csf3